ncbi:hypothetical protein B0H11DRAFT_205458 [Mycena galericulata]|nr:hypothetical protein B0H11DRAFT_205458 [Mycena galericulata]
MSLRRSETSRRRRASADGRPRGGGVRAARRRPGGVHVLSPKKSGASKMYMCHWMTRSTSFRVVVRADPDGSPTRPRRPAPYSQIRAAFSLPPFLLASVVEQGACSGHEGQGHRAGLTTISGSLHLNPKPFVKLLSPLHRAPALPRALSCRHSLITIFALRRRFDPPAVLRANCCARHIASSAVPRA